MKPTTPHCQRKDLPCCEWPNTTACDILTAHRDAIALAHAVDDHTLFRRATEFALVNFADEQFKQEVAIGLDEIVPKDLISTSSFHTNLRETY